MLTKGNKYNTHYLTPTGWAGGEDDDLDGYNVWDYFDEGVYLGPDLYGVEPTFLDKVVVTRHPALIDLIFELEIGDENTILAHHVASHMIEGKHVIGVLPLHLAALANKVTEIPLNLTPEDRGKELSLERIKEIMSEPKTYRVREIAHNK